MAKDLQERTALVANHYFMAKKHKETGLPPPELPSITSDWANDATSTPTTTDITAETAPLDRTIIEHALITYVTPFDQTPPLTDVEQKKWRDRFSQKGWWRTWTSMGCDRSRMGTEAHDDMMMMTAAMRRGLLQSFCKGETVGWGFAKGRKTRPAN